MPTLKSQRRARYANLPTRMRKETGGGGKEKHRSCVGLCLPTKDRFLRLPFYNPGEELPELFLRSYGCSDVDATFLQLLPIIDATFYTAAFYHIFAT